MVIIEDLKIKLPKTELAIQSFFSNCSNRNKFVKDTEKHYIQHLKKAKHDLERAHSDFKDGCWDWTIIKAYYAIHHAGNTLLSKNKNMFSKDHSCLIVALKALNLIDNSLFDELIKIHERFSDVFSLDITFQLRKISQYNVDEWEKLTEADARLILNISKKFVKFVEEQL